MTVICTEKSQQPEIKGKLIHHGSDKGYLQYVVVKQAHDLCACDSTSPLRSGQVSKRARILTKCRHLFKVPIMFTAQASS